ncbi:MFS transporter [Serratia sp. IR-2025]|uniref:MFS transporter n=1 Tax=Serratia TaxID=613 RepID=UPI000744DD09|nr:MFS transporter [Serratia marcescens]CUY89698.1 Major Facilitator Superfamily [Serratia marcescens]HEJ7301785.1 MFS transporter [Serratia marcescens]HEJ8047091.1 MFS transporter [Serratia marcescens]
MKTHPLSGKIAWCIGLTQLINWGITFYLLGAFGDAIAHDTAWGQPLIFSGLTLAMVVMGLVSPVSGRLLALMGGRKVMQLGALLNGLGCLFLATSHSLDIYFLAWLVMGIGMRLSLYDAAFAVLVNIGGATARKSIAQVTLLGGLASVVFWPIGEGLLNLLGWRWGVGCYCLFALISIALCISLPDGKEIPDMSPHPPKVQSGHPSGGDRLKGGLYAALMALLSFLATGISTHLPLILTSSGVPVLVGALWGVGQVSARFGDVVMGSRSSALGLNLVVGILLPCCFIIGLVGLTSIVGTGLFVLGYGAINGLSTLVRATLPLTLFEPHLYASRMGTLLMPSFFLSALAPSLYASFRERFGDTGMLVISLGLACIAAIIAIVIYLIGTGKRALKVAPVDVTSNGDGEASS